MCGSGLLQTGYYNTYVYEKHRHSVCVCVCDVWCVGVCVDVCALCYKLTHEIRAVFRRL